MTETAMERVLMVRVSSQDAHYGGDLVDGAYVLKLFGDALTFISCRGDGDEGLLSSYESVEFKEPVRPGDFLAINCREVERTRLTRTVDVAATRQGRGVSDANRASAAEAWNESDQIVAAARARIVLPLASAKRRGGGI